MTIWFVHRNDGPGTPISMAGQQEQIGYAEEQLDDQTSTELQTFLAPPFDPIAAGLQVISTGTPGLTGAYAIDTPAQQNISGIAAGIASRNRVPGGGATFNYGDADGNLHAFTGAEFLNFASAVEDYLYALLAGNPPSQPVTIP